MRDSSERRKKPRREGSGREREEMTETDETEMATWPVWVKPNFSKRIMERASLVIVRDLISAEVGWRRRRRVAVRTAMKGRFGIFDEEEGDRVVVVVVGGERSG